MSNRNRIAIQQLIRIAFHGTEFHYPFEPVLDRLGGGTHKKRAALETKIRIAQSANTESRTGAAEQRHETSKRRFRRRLSRAGLGCHCGG